MVMKEPGGKSTSGVTYPDHSKLDWTNTAMTASDALGVSTLPSPPSPPAEKATARQDQGRKFVGAR
jgi:hypothetical protein